MTMKFAGHSSFSEKVRSKAKRGHQGFPMATIAYYGPDDQRASKVAVGIIAREDAEPDPLERWTSEFRDVRIDVGINKAIYYLLLRHAVKSVVIADRIMGCPHEEGIDYPEGENCPKCLYWANRDRFSGEILN